MSKTINICTVCSRVFLSGLCLCAAFINGSDSCQAVETKIQQAASWPIYHGDAGLRGIADGPITEKPSVLWRYKTGSSVSLPPVLSGGRIFFVTEKGEASALNMAGGKVWSAAIRNEQSSSNTALRAEQYMTSPMCMGDMVFIGSDEGVLYALDAATGKSRWKYKIGESVNGTANWIDAGGGRESGVVAISQSDGAVHCVEAGTGKARWVSKPVSRCDGSPGVGKDFVVLGSCDSALHFISIVDGSAMGQLTLEGDGQVAGGVAVDGDIVFAGTRGGLIVCGHARKPEVVWATQTGESEAFATPAVTRERVVTGCNDGKVYCLKRTDGKIVWSFTVDGNPLSPVVAADKVIVSAGGTLYILNMENGSKLWSVKTGDLISSPAVSGGKIVVGTDTGFVIMYGEGK